MLDFLYHFWKFSAPFCGYFRASLEGGTNAVPERRWFSSFFKMLFSVTAGSNWRCGDDRIRAIQWASLIEFSHFTEKVQNCKLSEKRLHFEIWNWRWFSHGMDIHLKVDFDSGFTQFGSNLWACRYIESAWNCCWLPYKRVRAKLRIRDSYFQFLSTFDIFEILNSSYLVPSFLIVKYSSSSSQTEIEIFGGKDPKNFGFWGIP